MNIAVKSDIHTGVPKYFTQALNLKANFNTASSKCMPKRMKVCIGDAALLYIQLEMILHNASSFDVSALLQAQPLGKNEQEVSSHKM